MKMPKFCFPTNPTVDVVKNINTISRHGPDLIELGAEAPLGKADDLLKKVGKIKAALKRNDIGLEVIHTPWWMEFGSQYEQVRKAWVAEAKKSINLARKLGAGKVCFHAHSRGMAVREGTYKRTVLKPFSLSMKQLAAFARPYKIRVMLENTPGKSEISDFENFKWIIDHTPGLFVHLDVGHAFILGGMKEIERYLKTFKRKVIYIHLHDNNGIEDEHVGFEHGKINLKKVVRLLKKYDYSHEIGFEVFSGWKEARRSLKMTKRLWKLN
jgi:sugar phosphate isomerase/epimerase